MIRPEVSFRPGDLVSARGREWVVLPETRIDLLRLRPLGGANDDATLIYLPLEPDLPAAATFELPSPDHPGTQAEALLLRDALRLNLRAGAGPFRSFGNINVEPRAYQLVPLLMALKQDPIRLLIADDVGIGKTIEACLIARELIDRGEIERLTVICPPHLCEQWRSELAQKFSLDAEIVRTATAARLERGLRPDESIFEVYPYTVVSLDYIKSDRRRNDFLRACPEFVIVDEAHTCVQANTNTRHQRHQLLKGLAEVRPSKNMLFLTATPHSGDDAAFHNLLGLLDRRFGQLGELPEGDQRRLLRGELAAFFVQRRRGDIAEWRDSDQFPVRESRETTYQLTGEWGQLFDDVLVYARTMVLRAEGGSRLEQRMSWWAALALLRCLSSSPAAARLALSTRLRVAEGKNAGDQLAELDLLAGETVLDEATDDSLTVNETVPAGTLESADDAAELRTLIDRSTSLLGPNNDPKLKRLIREVRKILREGFNPVVFCRYVATAHYIGEQLRDALPKRSTHVAVITGEFTPERRQELVDGFEDLKDGINPVLIATDCLSEGINLQRHFDAVIHYDLTWNPTRHEQREGRVDRFGQASSVARALMLYGANNPVDGAVLRVILRKAERIRKELGVAVPLPADNGKVIDAIMQAVLLKGSDTGIASQMTLELDGIDNAIEQVWSRAAKRSSGTIFAQRSLRPNEVMPDWQKSVSVLGGPSDVSRFVQGATQRLGAPLDRQNGYSRLPVEYLPSSLQDRLLEIGLKSSLRLSFSHPAPSGGDYVHRSHPLVTTLAEFVTEQALDIDRPEIGARAGAIFTQGVNSKTVLFLLRLRSQLQIDQLDHFGQSQSVRSLLAEECVAARVQGAGEPELIADHEGLRLLTLEPHHNMTDGQKSHLIRQVLSTMPTLEPAFDDIAKQRASELLSDHRRIRDASAAKGLRYRVDPSLPVDKIGVYVFLPVAGD